MDRPRTDWTLDLEGEIVEQGTLLDGTRELVVEGGGAAVDLDEPWQFSVSVRWPKEAAPEEGEVTLTDPAGATLYGALRGGSIERDLDEDAAVELVRLDLTFSVESGDGAFGEARGTLRLMGSLLGDEARLRADLALAERT